MHSRWATTSTYATACWAATKSRTSAGRAALGVTARPIDDVYMTQPLAGGPERAVHRKDIMPATAPFSVVDAAGQQSPSSRPDVSN